MMIKFYNYEGIEPRFELKRVRTRQENVRKSFERCVAQAT